MPQFAYWYAYFDTIFTKKFPTPAPTLTHIISGNRKQQPHHRLSHPTPTPILPDLCQCFQQLQQFILEQTNWSESICTIDQLNKIQADVTNVLVLLEIQKKYIEEFWDWDRKRRVEASVTHLYAILQIFVGAIIPYDNMTLFQCKAANKLCLKIVNLQDLFKSIMKKINSICSFFSDQFFNEENQILKNFFENFVAFMKMIPKIRKAKMFHISQLLKYIMIVNPIQISEIKIQKLRLKAKKQRQRQSRLHKSVIKQKIPRRKSMDKQKKQVKIFNGVIIRDNKKHQSCIKLCQQVNNSDECEFTFNKLLRFIFPTWIRRHSIKHRKQSIPKLQIQPLVGLPKGKSSSQFFRAESPSYLDRQKRLTKLRNKSATKSRFLLKSSTIAYGDSSTSPTKMPGLTKNYSTVQKITTATTAFNDDDEINTVQITQPSHKKKQKQEKQKLIICMEMNLERKKNVFCIRDMIRNRNGSASGYANMNMNGNGSADVQKNQEDLQTKASIIRQIEKIILK